MRKILIVLILLFPCVSWATDLLEQSTATDILIGPLVDPTDASPEAGLTISASDVRLSKNAGVFNAKSDATACTTRELGLYSCELNASDTGTLGILNVTVDDGGNALVWSQDYYIVSSAFMNLVEGATDVNTVLERIALFSDDIDSVTTQTQLVENENAPALNDTYIGNELCIRDEGATPEEVHCAVITDYGISGGTGTFTIASGQILFTIASGDTYFVRPTGANAKAINSVKLKGIGTSGSPWGPDD